jgi:predicted DNA-binding transcriptional regulator AlpA
MRDSTTPTAQGVRHLNSDQLAARLGVSTRQVERMRQDGSGPPFIRVGLRAVAYAEADVVAWESSRRFSSTSHETVAAGRRPEVPA